MPLTPKQAVAQKQLELVYARNERESSKSLTAYLERVVIDCLPQPCPFGEVAESWQRERNKWLVPAIELVSGLGTEYDGPMNFYLGYAKGQDKSSYIGRVLNWIIAYGKTRGLRLYCGAKDSEQAGVILDCMKKEADLNSWFNKHLKFTRNGAYNESNNARLEILASDSAGAHGKNPSVVICDELTHWSDSGLFNSLYTASIKRATKERSYCVTIILTNAGYKDTWQYDLRGLAKSEHGKSWFFYEQPEGKTLASWITPEAIAVASRAVSIADADRLFYNKWLDLKDERGAFRPSDIDACIGEPTKPNKHVPVILCIDYGGVKDPTALAAMWYDGEKIHLFEQDCWQGTYSSEIRIKAVDEWIDAKLIEYPNAVVVFDKYQLLASIQRLEDKGVKVVRFEYGGGRNNAVMLQHLRTLLANRQLVIPSYAGYNTSNGSTLIDELKSVIIKTMSYGDRLDHSTTTHDDRVVTLGMGTMEAVKHPYVLPVVVRQVEGDLHRGSPTAKGRRRAQHDNFTRRGLYGIANDAVI